LALALEVKALALALTPLALALALEFVALTPSLDSSDSGYTRRPWITTRRTTADDGRYLRHFCVISRRDVTTVVRGQNIERLFVDPLAPGDTLVPQRLRIKPS